MKLNEMLRNITPLQVIGDAEMEIKGVNIDSRKIQHGHLFVAVKGTQVDGHQYIDKAIEQGATAVLCETLPQPLAKGVTFVQVADTEDAVGKVAT